MCRYWFSTQLKIEMEKKWTWFRINFFLGWWKDQQLNLFRQIFVQTDKKRSVSKMKLCKVMQIFHDNRLILACKLSTGEKTNFSCEWQLWLLSSCNFDKFFFFLLMENTTNWLNPVCLNIVFFFFSNLGLDLVLSKPE